MSTTLTLTPLRCDNPRKNRGIPTIPTGPSDDGTADVSTVDTELPTGSTPRGPAWSQRRSRAPSPGAAPGQPQPQVRVNPRIRGADA
ncbi:hypothetical protein FK267_01650 [Actinomyces oris]|uniref:Uncharacterized protein n=1 Tax=Actinomyces oris TaxID=544580 RepID=A0A508BRJ7_9ACTO|nr:hypothetical protein FK267_01650 [Actinomyces oris]